jgi:hypothetical protein
VDEIAGSSGPSAKGKPRGKPFQKGVSGNPGGRSRTHAELQQAFLERSPKALACLVAEIDEAGPQRVKASEIILAYGLGKPTQAVEHSGKDGGPLQVVVMKYGAEGDE